MDHIGDYDFSALSLKDLIEARDLYHFHLMSKPNVVGTAVGSYLIRDSDPKDGTPPPESHSEPRTFANAHVRRYSWPCILVLVREWLAESDFLDGHHLFPRAAPAFSERFAREVIAPLVAGSSIHLSTRR